MELREWAIRILSGDTLEEKLLDPPTLTDQAPGPALLWKEPTRPSGLGFSKYVRKDKLPSFHEHTQPQKRAVCLHRFAGHELLAVEIMAYALLAFPGAPKHFRKGLANTLKEEQEHVRLYCKRLKELGLCFGDLPLHKHFWAYTPFLHTPEAYISMMSLTFEMANLDYAPLYGASFAKAGDGLSAELMARILKDELAHVGFGWNWLKKLTKQGEPMWQRYLASLPPILSPQRAKGPVYHSHFRQEAGISQDFIDSLGEASSTPSCRVVCST